MTCNGIAATPQCADEAAAQTLGGQSVLRLQSSMIAVNRFAALACGDDDECTEAVDKKVTSTGAGAEAVD